MEGSQCKMWLKMARVISNIYLAVFYAPLVPYSIVLIVLTLFNLYWINKYTLLRKHKRPKVLGKNFQRQMLHMMCLVPFMHMFGSIIFNQLKRGEDFLWYDEVEKKWDYHKMALEIPILLVSLFYYLFDWRYAIRSCFRK